MRSLLETPSIVRRHRISNDSSLRESPAFNVQVSDAYIAIGRMSALYSLTFKDLEMDLLLQIVGSSLPKAVEANAILRFTSAAVSGTILPRKTNSVTCSTISESMITGKLYFMD